MQPLTRTPDFLAKAHTSRAGRTGGELYHCKGQAPKAQAGPCWATWRGKSFYL